MRIQIEANKVVSHLHAYECVYLRRWLRYHCEAYCPTVDETPHSLATLVTSCGGNADILMERAREEAKDSILNARCRW